MARTQAADYEQRRTAIVEQAAKLYAAHGFLGAPLAELASACNTSKSLIYHYYPSKEDILFDVMDSHVEALNDAADAILQGPGAPAERLRMLARAIMRLYVGAAARHKVLLNELDNLPAEHRATIVAHQRRLIDRVEGLLIEVQPGLKANTRILRPVTMLFFGMINWTHTWLDPKGAVSPEAIADLAVEMTLSGLAGLA
jgi:AcrR family transcriptional regulator